MLGKKWLMRRDKVVPSAPILSQAEWAAVKEFLTAIAPKEDSQSAGWFEALQAQASFNQGIHDHVQFLDEERHKIVAASNEDFTALHKRVTELAAEVAELKGQVASLRKP